MALLEVSKLGISFGGLRAVDNFNLTMGQNDLFGLIGPNGAGKTTVFNMLTGVYKPTDGSIMLDGTELVSKKSHEIVKLGVARTFQNIRLFKKMTVIDNVKVAYNNSMKYSALTGMFRLPSYWREEKAAEEEAMALLEVFNMTEVSDQMAENLPYGRQRKLEILRALASKPKILLLDEPAAGMNPTETAELMETIRFIRGKFNISILLIEHDMSLVLGICEKIKVLDYGTIIAEGVPSEVVRDKKVIEAYLGE